MGVAKYFSKDLLAINQLIQNNGKDFSEILLSARIGLAFDSNAITTKEGNMCLDLLIRLIARLYPNINIIDLSKNNDAKVDELSKLAESINSSISIGKNSDSLNVLIIVGNTDFKVKNRSNVFYIGSDNWNAKFSDKKALSFGRSHNPFGCGIAACIAVSNVFRIIFKEFLPDKKPDNDLEFSTLTYSTNELNHNPPIQKVNFTDVVLVGVGAIGNGCLWALSNLDNIGGKLAIVDDENVALSNLQRYVMFTENHLDCEKVKIAKTFFESAHLEVVPYNTRWSGYIKERNDFNIEMVLVGIDNKNDRIGIQSTLPKKIINSYTESNLLGVARHLDFINTACLACGYIPSQKERNYIEEVAVNCNIPNNANMIKAYINLNLPVNEYPIIQGMPIVQNTSSLLDVIAEANHIERNELNQFNGKKVNEFYSEFICGGISLSLSKNGAKVSNVDAPLAFQSAMAGILLAAEAVINTGNFRKDNIKQQSHIYPLNPINQNNPFNHDLMKNTSGRCLCEDEDFIIRYKEKWQANEYK